MSSSIHEKTVTDSLMALDILALECVASNTLFLGRMKLFSTSGFLRVFHLKKGQVPSTIAAKDNTIVVDDTKTIQEWFELALLRGWYSNIHDTFPSSSAYDDFSEQMLDKPVLDKLAALKLTVDTLDNLYHTDAEFQQALQSGGDIHSAILTETQAREGADSALDTRVQTLESATYVSHTELAQETTARATADSDLDARVQLLESVDYGTQAELDLEKGRLDVIELNKNLGSLKELEDDYTLKVSQETSARTTALSDLVSSLATTYVYCDASRTDSYTEDGSKTKPYKTLTAAFGLITDATTDDVVFCLAPGKYVGTVSVTKSSQNQNVTIIGSGIHCCFLQGTSLWNGSMTDSVLFLRKFNDVSVKNLTFENGSYGFYPRECRRVECENVRFRHLGASSDAGNFDFTKTQAERAAIWAGSETNSGGACRIRSCASVFVKDCEVFETLRGLRIQDCGEGVVSNCQTNRTIESGIYLAAGSYTGTDGCNDFIITGCIVRNAFNNGYLVIGGKRNRLIGNVAQGCANAGVQLWHTLDCTVKSNTLQNCNQKNYNGIGNNGDAKGQIVCDGNSNIGAGKFLAELTNNSVLQSNIGSAVELSAIALAAGAYPSESNRCYLSGNISDVKLKTGSFPVVLPASEKQCKVLTQNFPSASSKGELGSEGDQLFLGTQTSYYALPTALEQDARLHIRAGQETINIFPPSGSSLWDVDASTTTQVASKQLPDTSAKSFYYQKETNKWFYI